MSIPANDGGTLRKLSAITANDSGTLRVLKSISVNDGGVLRSIYSKAIFPDAQSGHFSYSTSSSAVTMQALGNAFKITGTTTVTVNLSNIKYGSGSTKHIQLSVFNAQTDEEFTVMELSNGLKGASPEAYGSATATITASGNYIVKAILFSVSGSQSGVSYYNGSCDYTITFS